MDFLLHHLLQTSAAEHPDRVAAVDGSTVMTFAELDMRSNQLANLLIELGVERGDRIGIYLDKSLASIVAIFGILKSGAAYVPFDPLAPVSRLAYMARNACIEVLVSGSEKADAWPDLVVRGASLRALVVLNAHDEARYRDTLPGVPVATSAALAEQPTDPPSVEVIGLDLAYILYTSGSTGEPKGVKLSHLNALTFVEWAAEICAIGPDDRLTSHAPLHFDLSIFDIFAAAKGAATVVLVPPEAFVFPTETARFISDSAITIWYSVPSALSMMVERGGLRGREFADLRIVLFAGEVFPTRYLRELMELLPHADFVNLYGPTETNVCTYYRVPTLAPDRTTPVPIGRAIEGVEVFAVTDEGNRVSVGETGELYVRGPSVMQGYWDNQQRTDAVLVPHPIGGSTTPDLVYRTGDLVRLEANGNYTLLGRRDNQVKSRGYRIELGDVETALYAHPSVVECAVTAVPDELVTNRIKASVVVRDGVEKADLVRFCSDRIPAYMIPEFFEFLDQLPKTSTGKIDRRMLSATQSTKGEHT